MRRRIIFFGSAVCALGIFGIFVLHDPASGARMTISFLGYTNVYSGVFRLHTESRFAVSYWVGVPQMKTNGAWAKPHFGTNDSIWTPPSVVTRGVSSTFAVEVPSGKEEWNRPVIWYVNGRQTSPLGILKYNVRVFRLWWPHRSQARYPGLSKNGESDVHVIYSSSVTR